MRNTVIVAVMLVIVSAFLCGCGSKRVSKATDLIQVGSFSEAEKLLQEEVTNNPKNAEAYFVFGQCLSEQGKATEAQERFKSAIAADGNLKAKVIEYLLGEHKGSSYSDLVFVNEIDPNRIKSDRDFCYRYCVKESDSDATRQQMFIDNFPNDREAPKVALAIAEWATNDGDSQTAKAMLQRIVREYPKSPQAKEAKARLANWWEIAMRELPVDNRWHSFPIRKGQRYRYDIPGEIVIPVGPGVRATGDNVYLFVGSAEELHEAQMNTVTGLCDKMNSYRGPFFEKAGRSGGGVAPRSGRIWFTVDCGIITSSSLGMNLEVKS